MIGEQNHWRCIGERHEYLPSDWAGGKSEREEVSRKNLLDTEEGEFKVATSFKRVKRNQGENGIVF
jgi:hypothetical protein